MNIPGSAPGQDGPPPAAGADSPTLDRAPDPTDQAGQFPDRPSGSEAAPEPAEIQVGPRSGAAQLIGPLVVYTLLRLTLIVVLTALLMFFMPLIVALLFAIIVQLPLSWLLFAGPRRRLNDAMAQSSAKRRSERAKLQSALSGTEPPPADR
jgi:hypothetical protein